MAVFWIRKIISPNNGMLHQKGVDAVPPPERVHGLAPIIDPTSRILILGSLPGAKSIELQQYYGNPSNHFWRILSAIFGQEPGGTYPEKIAFLKRNHLALWDVVESAARKTSLDKDIKQENPNDLAGLLANYPAIERILLNGGTAEKLFLKYHAGQIVLPHQRVSSSSPIPGRNVKSLPEKILEWKQALQPD